MPINTEEAMASYGFVFNLANSIPELKGYLEQAVAGQWTPDKLTATIQSSPWWRTHSDTVRNLAALNATDPASYQLNLENAKQLVYLKAWQLGRAVNDDLVTRMANLSLITNPSWDDQRLTWLITNNAGLYRGENGGGELSGQAAQLNEHMTQVAKSYGVGFTQQWLDGWIGQVSSGLNSLDGFEQLVRARAKAAFPQFASQIDAGMTIRDVADPYISTMAQTLELNETNITLDDRYIKQALAQTGQDGATRTSMPLWQFERTLKNDERYDKTKQAKGDAFAVLSQIGRDFGFAATGASA